MLRLFTSSIAPSYHKFAGIPSAVFASSIRLCSSATSPPPPPDTSDSNAKADEEEELFFRAVGAIEDDRSDVSITAPTLEEMDDGPWYIVTRRFDKNLVAGAIDIQQGKRVLVGFGGFGFQIPIVSASTAEEDPGSVRLFSIPDRMGWGDQTERREKHKLSSVSDADAASLEKAIDGQSTSTSSSNEMKKQQQHSGGEQRRYLTARERRKLEVGKRKTFKKSRQSWPKKIDDDEAVQLRHLAMAQVSRWFSHSNLKTQVPKGHTHTEFCDKDSGEVMFRDLATARPKKNKQTRPTDKAAQQLLVRHLMENPNVVGGVHTSKETKPLRKSSNKRRG